MTAPRPPAARRAPAALAALAAVAALTLSGAAGATDVNVLGLFAGKALLVIDGAAPRTYAVGDRLAEGMTLVAADSSGATIEEKGRRSVLALGQYVGNGNGGSGSGGGGHQGSVTLPADSLGHFIANGQINGASARMMVDTGASLVSLPASDARRMGIDYLQGRVVGTNTANGRGTGYLVRIDRIRIGDLEVFQVDAMVLETGLSIILLGNSFLNRCDMQRNAQQLTLTKRF
jgi:aspartyl protease family protein